jgi:tRNA nucleotidyltransferase (CCA-adding enzyme)
MLFQKLETIDSKKNIEFEKILLTDKFPSSFFRKLLNNNCLDKLFPELAILVRVKQKPNYHPEGNVFEHTMQALDAAAQFTYQEIKEKRIIMLAVLCHDYGKAQSLQPGKSMNGHDIAGVPITEKFLKRFLYSKDVIKSVCKLVLYHKKPFEIFNKKPNADSINNLKTHFNSTSSRQQLSHVFWADLCGRNGNNKTPLTKESALKQILKIDKNFQNFINNIKD